MDCVFCKIINGEIPCYNLYEDDNIIAFLDINPVSPGHTLIVPKKHTLDITTIDNDTLMKIISKSKDMAKLFIDKLNADGFTLVQNNGNVQDVKHFHLHVIPKYNKKINMSVEKVFEVIKK